MRLNYLKIHNIASIEDAEIDFANGPLGQDSTFLITGPTGSGKTTILDCISLALFDTTPRLSDANSEDIVDYNNDPIKSDRPEQLLRRGTGKSSIELRITDKDNHLKTIIWECRRARNRFDGKVQNVSWRILDSQGNTLTDKKTDTEDMILESIGMTYEQFCKTSMLAQGEFTKFLKANDSDKSAILEKLTGTQIYSKISMEIQKISSEKKRELEDARLTLQGISLLDDEKVASLKQDISRLEEESKKLGDSIKEMNSKCEWLHNHTAATEDEKKIREELDTLLGQTKSSDFQTKKSQITDWDRSQDILEYIRKRKNVTERQKELHGQQDEWIKRYNDLYKGYNWLVADIQEKDIKLSALKVQWEELSKNKKTYDHIGEISALTGQYNQNESLIQKARRSSKEYAQEIEKLKTGQKAKNIELEAFQEQDCLNQDALYRAQKDLERMDLPALAEKSAAMTKKIAVLNDLQMRIDVLRNLEKESADHNSSLEECNKEIIEQRGILSKLKIEDLKKAFNSSRERYLNVKTSCEDVAQGLRNELKIGDICPVCGKKIEQNLTDEHFQNIVRPLKDEAEQAEEELKKANDRSNTCLAFIRELEKTIDKHNKRIPDLLSEIKEKKDFFKDNPVFQEFRDTPDPASAIKENLKVCTEQQKKIQEKIQDCSVQQKKITSLQSAKDSSGKALQAAQKTVQDILNGIRQNEQSILEKEEQIKQYDKTQGDILEQLRQLITIQDWEAFWNEDRNKLLKQLKEDTDRFESLSTDIQLKENQIRTGKANLEEQDEKKSAIEALHLSWLIAEVPEKQEDRQLSRNWNHFMTQISTYCRELENNGRDLFQSQQKIDEYLQTENHLSEERLVDLNHLDPSSILEYRQEIKETEQNLSAKRSELKMAQNIIMELEKKKPEFKEDETENYLKESEIDLKGKRDSKLLEIGSLRTTLENNEVHKKNYHSQAEQVTKAEKISVKWSKLHELFGSADGKRFRNIAQSYVLKNLLDCANAHLHTLSNRYQLTCRPGSLTILLKDTEAGDVIRPTNTLSGGESFLVSLSLALGLSSLAKADVSTDIIFIDEGFGTLDKEYLDTVLGALERLHQSKGKKVGIISHVETLKERITTQILIEPGNTTASKVRVISTI